jgi:hypothetical protein
MKARIVPFSFAQLNRLLPRNPCPGHLQPLLAPKGQNSSAQGKPAPAGAALGQTQRFQITLERSEASQTSILPFSASIRRLVRKRIETAPAPRTRENIPSVRDALNNAIGDNSAIHFRLLIFP